MKDAIQYTVTVTAIVERRETLPRTYGKVGQKQADFDAAKLVDQMGWVPEVDGTVRKDIEVFKQTVDTLDMSQLVHVVNGTKAATDKGVDVRIDATKASRQGQAIAAGIKRAVSRRV